MNLITLTKTYENDNNLNEETKKIRLQLLEAYFKINELKKQKDTLSNIYINKAIEYQSILKFKFSKDIDDDIFFLKQILLRTNEVQELEKQKINYKIINLKKYDNDVINKTVDLYEILVNIKRTNKQIKNEIINGLSILVSPDILSDSRLTITQSNNTISQKKEKKSKIDLENDKTKIITILNNNHDVLGNDVYNITFEMFSELFNSYNEKEEIKLTK